MARGIATVPRHLRVFLSSPGDVETERDAADGILAELSRLHAWKGKFTLEPVRWDDPHAPVPMDAQLTPQAAMDRGLPKPSECDIVVVILWGRMGTPLPESYKKPNGDFYVSGTEYEYEDARQAGKPILLYRRTEKPQVDIDDPDFEKKSRQYRLVQEFFKRFQAPDGSLSGGYTGYEKSEEFPKRFRQDMEALLCQWEDGPAEEKNPAARRPEYVPPVTQAYRDWLKRDCGGVELLGMRLRHGQAVRVHHIYVPITTRGQEPDVKRAALGRFAVDDRKARAEHPALVLNAFARASLYLSGAPGSGKSTFCRWLAWLVCEGAMPAHEVPVPEGYAEAFPETVRDHLPVLVRLRDFWRFLPRLPEGSDLSRSELEEGLVRWLASKQPDGLAPEGLQTHLDRGTALLVLDGLDEIPVDVDGGARSSAPRSLLVSGLKDACAAWTKKGNRILLTSRPYGLAPTDTPEGLSHVPIEPLSDELQEILIERWFRVLADSEEAALETSRDMQAHLDGHPWLAPLRANPLLLTAMCIIYDEGKRLPQDKHDLYDRIVDTVLHGRYREDVAKGAARNRLCVIAHGMHSGEGLGEERTTPQAECTYAEIERMLGAYQKKSLWSEEGYLGAVGTREELLSQSGLLLPSGDKRARFYHLSFQEFLAAQRILEVTEGSLLDVMHERAAYPEWRNTLSLLFGRMLGTHVSPERGIKLTREMIGATGPGTTGLPVVMADCIDTLLAKGIRLPEADEVRLREIFVCELRAKAPAVDRAAIGASLARLGDPRLEVLDPDEIQFCCVPEGGFWLGSGDEDNMAFDNEQVKGRAQRFKLDYGYWMARFPVTNAQFACFVTEKGYDDSAYWPEARTADIWRDGEVQGRMEPYDFGTPFGLPNHPVVGITWYEALAYTRWLTERWREAGYIGADQQEVALPSEPEWEKAARGGLVIPKPEAVSWRPAKSGLTGVAVSKDALVANAEPQRRYPWGPDPDPNRANYEDIGIGTTSAVGCFPGGASPYGCEEMSGNVWEWTRSLWGQYPYPEGLADLRKREVLDAPPDKGRVLRGGGFDDDQGGVRCAYRDGDDPGGHDRDIGFRVVVRPFL